MNEPAEKSPWWTKLLSRPGWLVLLAVCLLLSAIVLPFGWRYYRTQQLIRHIEEIGGTVSLDPIGPEWIHATFKGMWRRPFQVPSRVYLTNEELDDAEFREYVIPLNEMNQLTGLLIADSAISKSSLHELGLFQNLRFLAIFKKDLDDETLRQIGSLAHLDSLTLDHTPISNEGLLHFQELKNLKHLSVVNTNVTEQGLEELQRHLPQLEVSDD